MSGLFTEKAPVKINLSLKVKGRRHDGYHELQSLVVFVDCGESLRAEAAAALSLNITGPFAGLLAGEQNNLVLEAVRLFDEYTGLTTSAEFTLDKQVPVASGIGGGSADAAAALRLLCRYHDHPVKSHALAALGLCIGADVPVCLEARPALMWGKGELLTRLDTLPDFWLVLVNPRVAVSTAEVFKALDAAPLAEKEEGPDVPDFVDLAALVGWLIAHGNDLEAPAKTIAPAIADVLAALSATDGCKLARMSGSGATCFGLYADEASATRAAAALRVTHPDWWVAAAPRI
ncbi:MAG: 4-(cytidine 5'-diphospho)-2-C-methyl-D-erythritol kinase [Parvibaculum sp.]|nr:4-(cytidine 5'-diphospho)-2-C-methyl-D-erythritol kinase [Parvibaculum sp.]